MLAVMFCECDTNHQPLRQQPAIYPTQVDSREHRLKQGKAGTMRPVLDDHPTHRQHQEQQEALKRTLKQEAPACGRNDRR
jgi:hypothetical protein